MGERKLWLKILDIVVAVIFWSIATPIIFIVALPFIIKGWLERHLRGN